MIKRDAMWSLEPINKECTACGKKYSAENNAPGGMCPDCSHAEIHQDVPIEPAHYEHQRTVDNRLVQHAPNTRISWGIWSACAIIFIVAANYYSTQSNYKKAFSETTKPVVMFTTSVCPYCAKVRQLFAKYKIPYHEYVTDKSDYAYEKFKAIDGNGVPLIYIGEHRLDGYNPVVILEDLDDEGLLDLSGAI